MLMLVGAIACGTHQRGAGTRSTTTDAQLAPSLGATSADALVGQSDMGSVPAQGPDTRASHVCVPGDQTEPDSEPGLEAWTTDRSNRDSVPLRVGLTAVTAIATPDGDYESVKSITELSDSTVGIDLSAEVPQYDGTTNKMIPTPLNSRRVVARADQDTACGFAPVFLSRTTTAPPERYEGTTGITFSARLLAALKAGQHVYVRVIVPGFGGGIEDRGHWVHRVEAHRVGVPVILNDHPVTLPAVHAQCDPNEFTLGRNGAHIRHLACEYYVLDDARDPVVLIWRKMSLQEDTTLREVSDSALRGTDKTGFRSVDGVLQLDTTQLEVVHLDEADVDIAGGVSGAGGGAGERRMEQALSRERKVVVYGIYFDFAQATIKKASGPVLHEIADLMRRNPTWSLTINGYTDSIGGNAHNLGLSRRRATAIRDTLVSGFAITPARLSATGFGSASSVDSNSTLEGRARNRRVELIRR